MGEKKNFDDFLQSTVMQYILLCSVGTVHFEDKVIYEKLLSKKKAVDWYII